MKDQFLVPVFVSWCEPDFLIGWTVYRWDALPQVVVRCLCFRFRLETFCAIVVCPLLAGSYIAASRPLMGGTFFNTSFYTPVYSPATGLCSVSFWVQRNNNNRPRDQLSLVLLLENGQTVSLWNTKDDGLANSADWTLASVNLPMQKRTFQVRCLILVIFLFFFFLLLFSSIKRTVRSDVVKRGAEERLAWNHKNFPSWPEKVIFCESFAHYYVQCTRLEHDENAAWRLL